MKYRCTAALLACSMVWSIAAPAAALPAHTLRPVMKLDLPKDRKAEIYASGIVRIYSKDRRQVETRLVPLTRAFGPLGASSPKLPDKYTLLASLSKDPARPFAPQRVVVVFRDGVGASQETTQVGIATLEANRQSVTRHRGVTVVPNYTNDHMTNEALATLGVDRSEHLFSKIANESAGLRLKNVYRMHVTGASVLEAVRALAKLSTVTYVSPDWTVDTMHSDAVPVQRTAPRAWGVTPSATSGIPTNYGVSTSLESSLDAPATNTVAAYDEIWRHYHQLPGQGEIITNLSLGDLDDSSIATNFTDPCFFYVLQYGPTTTVINGQRYADLPSMPLIPTYTADDAGALSGTNEVCGVDPFWGEIGLDLSVMAPLPHNVQRTGEIGSGVTDLLGIAPGASYRLVVPASSTPTFTDIQAALLAAALQQPHPNIITASVGYGEDQFGFPGRYFEEDPLTEAMVAAIVQQYHIVVCLAANDGTRSGNGFPYTAIGPSGGSAPTNVVTAGGTPTSIGDIALSTAPSAVFDSGAIDAGGTTLNDIFAVEPQSVAMSSVQRAQQTYAETRWTGFTSFSSGFGTRVNLAAPSDNIVSFQHNPGAGYDSVVTVLEGGTSAAAPEIAAATAVVQQVARLTGHPLSDPVKLRAFLAQTASPVAAIPQADVNVAVGSQVNVAHAVEALMTNASIHDAPSAPRVAVVQRRNMGNLDGVFQSDTEASAIDLQGPSGSDADELAWITIAPDWEFVSSKTKYRLTVASNGHVLTTMPWARLLPAEILGAAGMPLASTSPTRTVKLRYTATTAGKALVKDFSLTFGPADPATTVALAPQAPALVTGAKIPVSYDLSSVKSPASPELVVSEPGHFTPATGALFHPAYSVPLSSSKGKVEIPVSALQGGGVYGIGISYSGTYSDFAFTRVTPSTSSVARPPAPLLSATGITPTHNLEVPYGASVGIAYDVRDVPGATGAMLEVSSAGPTIWGSGTYNPFNNPNGTERDDNGTDTGSIYYAPLPGVNGTVSLSAATLGLFASMHHTLRVIPLKGGAAAGEAGDVSTLSMDGVPTADGGHVNNGYGIDQNGIDAFLTSGQTIGNISVPGSPISILSSVSTFDQTTEQLVQTIGPSSSALYSSPGAGVYGGGLAILGINPYPTGTVSYSLFTPSSGSTGTAWSMPYTDQIQFGWGAQDPAGQQAPFLVRDGTDGSFRVFVSQLNTGTFSPLYNLASAFQGLGSPSPSGGFAMDATLGVGFFGIIDFDNSSAPPRLGTIDLATGSITTFTGQGVGTVNGLAIDPTTHNAAVLTDGDGGLTIYNLSTQQGNEVILPGGFSGDFVTADPIAGRFLVWETTAPNYQQDNDSLSRVLVYDESGNLVETIAHFNFYNMPLSLGTTSLQANPSRRTGYVWGPQAYQLAPFTY